MRVYGNGDDENDNFYGAVRQHMPLQGCLDKNTSNVMYTLSK